MARCGRPQPAGSALDGRVILDPADGKQFVGADDGVEHQLDHPPDARARVESPAECLEDELHADAAFPELLVIENLDVVGSLQLAALEGQGGLGDAPLLGGSAEGGLGALVATVVQMSLPLIGHDSALLLCLLARSGPGGSLTVDREDPGRSIAGDDNTVAPQEFRYLLFPTPSSRLPGGLAVVDTIGGTAETGLAVTVSANSNARVHYFLDRELRVEDIRLSDSAKAKTPPDPGTESNPTYEQELAHLRSVISLRTAPNANDPRFFDR